MNKNDKEIVFSTKQFTTLDDSIKKYQNDPGALISILQDAQDIFGFLPLEVQHYIALSLGISLLKVKGVVSFYSMFKTELNNKHTVNVCSGNACNIKGATNLFDIVNKISNSKISTKQSKRCVGNCQHAPIVVINNDYYANVTSSQLEELIDELKRGDINE